MVKQQPAFRCLNRRRAAPRLVKVEDVYYIIWCQDFYGAAIGLAKTTDFKSFVRLENPFLPFNRNAVKSDACFPPLAFLFHIKGKPF